MGQTPPPPLFTCAPAGPDLCLRWVPPYPPGWGVGGGGLWPVGGWVTLVLGNLAQSAYSPQGGGVGWVGGWVGGSATWMGLTRQLGRDRDSLSQIIWVPYPTDILLYPVQASGPAMRHSASPTMRAQVMGILILGT